MSWICWRIGWICDKTLSVLIAPEISYNYLKSSKVKWEISTCKFKVEGFQCFAVLNLLITISQWRPLNLSHYALISNSLELYGMTSITFIPSDVAAQEETEIFLFYLSSKCLWEQVSFFFIFYLMQYTFIIHLHLIKEIKCVFTKFVYIRSIEITFFLIIRFLFCLSFVFSS